MSIRNRCIRARGETGETYCKGEDRVVLSDTYCLPYAACSLNLRREVMVIDDRLAIGPALVMVGDRYLICAL